MVVFKRLVFIFVQKLKWVLLPGWCKTTFTSLCLYYIHQLINFIFTINWPSCLIHFSNLTFTIKFSSTAYHFLYSSVYTSQSPSLLNLTITTTCLFTFHHFRNITFIAICSTNYPLPHNSTFSTIYSSHNHNSFHFTFTKTPLKPYTHHYMPIRSQTLLKPYINHHDFGATPDFLHQGYWLPFGYRDGGEDGRRRVRESLPHTSHKPCAEHLHLSNLVQHQNGGTRSLRKINR